MKSIYFKSAHILSLRDKKGFSFKFSPDINIITGENDTGKSSFIKSLYHTLGADIRLDKKWKEDDFVSKVVICVSNRDYAFLRHEKRISIFDITEGQEHHLVTSSSRTDIALTVRDIFDFNLELVTKSNLVQGQAQPASLYLPYYIDQDNGWGKVLDSFSSLAMYKDWQNNILNFHTGVKPKEYYTLQGKINLIDIDLVEIRATLKALEAAKKRFEESFGRVLFDVDVQYYEELLERFLHKCQDLHKEETEYRIKLIEVLSLRDELVAEIEESKRQLDENNIDSLPPSAGLEARYAVLEHRDKLLQIIPELYEQKSVYDDQITKIKEDLKNAKRLSSELKEMLKEVKEQLSLQDVINSQASKQVEVTFDEQINELLQKIGELDVVRTKLSKEIAKFEDKKRAKEINDKFKESLKFAQTELGIKDPKVGTILQYGPISKSETGSRAPRAILAYHYALLKTIEDKSTSPMLPVVIDSPKQQDPDPRTTKKLFDLCIDGLSTNCQLIIGSVSLERETNQFKTLTMTDKYSLLKPELYNQVYQEIMPLYQKAALS
ncbi:AAA family ATPase [Vibrio parahaemolyticus]|uniref:AAA family ATPase n=1 Tax=Vibrio parahaemolyticus TaxID=670 RepID=UPI000944213A|nr:AAA family ATPase [Vibrio parahaemolyticus]MBE4331581.1 AAA family ATPase [Vibrio parahaemolyticus]MBE4343756.1 AAA family ATPase [Vibrio parahaemolyticus]MDF4729247.1 AAA family ATPase [Vibrio parahaemolyticus]MDF4910072.1 AAA family ATPase [Vibrio parahaemolyticus]MDF4955472.1 AAA family ATPase [Vibrio parahaemolyticus]